MTPMVAHSTTVSYVVRWVYALMAEDEAVRFVPYGLAPLAVAHLCVTKTGDSCQHSGVNMFTFDYTE
jgi:hypothetical protein